MSTQSSDSVFNVLMHGIGAYFVARGIWMGATASQPAYEISLLERLVWLNEDEPVRDAYAARGSTAAEESHD